MILRHCFSRNKQRQNRIQTFETLAEKDKKDTSFIDHIDASCILRAKVWPARLQQPKATQNKTLFSQTFICEKRCGDAVFILCFVSWSKQAYMKVYYNTPVYMPAVRQLTNNDNDLYQKCTENVR